MGTLIHTETSKSSQKIAYDYLGIWKKSSDESDPDNSIFLILSFLKFILYVNNAAGERDLKIRRVTKVGENLKETVVVLYICQHEW